MKNYAHCFWKLKTKVSKVHSIGKFRYEMENLHVNLRNTCFNFSNTELRQKSCSDNGLRASVESKTLVLSLADNDLVRKLILKQFSISFVLQSIVIVIVYILILLVFVFAKFNFDKRIFLDVLWIPT